MTHNQINVLTKSEMEHHVQNCGCVKEQICLGEEKLLDMIATGSIGKITRQEEAYRWYIIKGLHASWEGLLILLVFLKSGIRVIVGHTLKMQIAPTGILWSVKTENHSISNGEASKGFKQKCDREVREEIKEEKEERSITRSKEI